MKTQDPTRTPVLVAIGQSIERDDIVNVPSLAVRAAEAAFAEAPTLRDRVQRLSLVGVSFSPVSDSAASEIAKELGLKDPACEITTPGGNTPQWLVGRACEAIAKGELETTLIVGAEATRSIKKQDPSYDFIMSGAANREEGEGEPDPVIGVSIRGMFSQAEIDARLLRPADIYPVFENARAKRDGLNPAETRRRIGQFMSRGTERAAGNPMAWFDRARPAGEFEDITEANRLTAEPYTKCMNSFANVDQGSALLVTTLAVAKEAGLADQCIFPWANANNADVVPAARAQLADSVGIRAAAGAAFEAAGVGIDDMDFIDIYSCFPIAVQIGAAEIGLALDDPRGLTQTGGMATFGGPGNNYTSHGIAAVAGALRAGGRLGYVSGNGGLLSKHSIGIYGNAPPPRGFNQPDTSAAQEKIEAGALEVIFEAEGEAIVDGATVVYGRNGEPVAAPVIAQLPGGRRVVANPDPGILGGLAGRNLVGETVRVSGASPPIYTI